MRNATEVYPGKIAGELRSAGGYPEGQAGRIRPALEVYMIKGEYDYLKDLASRNVCSEHGTPLLVATHPTDACYVLRCGEDHYPDVIRRIPSLTEEFAQGTLPDGPIADNIKKRSRKKAMTSQEPNKHTILGDIPTTDLATGDLLNQDMIRSLISYARKYDLDPYRGHVVIFYGKPYIGLDGYIYHANRSAKDYRIRSRPLTTEERLTYQIKDGDHAWTSEVVMQPFEEGFTGLGIVTQEELTETSRNKPGQLRYPVAAKHPHLLAQKRAEWQALRRAFPIGEPEKSPQEEVNNDD